MSLQKVTIELLPLGGVDQSRGEWATLAGPGGLASQFHTLDNLRYTKTGEIEKRAGLVAMSSAVLDGYAFGTTTDLVAVGGLELVAVGTRAEETASQPGEPGAFLWSYSPSADAWAPKTGVPQLSVERYPGVRGETDLDSAVTQVARVGTVEAILYTVGTNAYIRVVDRATGAVMLDNTALASAALAGKYVLFAVNGVFVVVWFTGANQLRRGTINPTTLALASANVGAALAFAPASWDAIPTVSGKWAMAAQGAVPGGDVVVWRVDNAAGTVDATAAELGRSGTRLSLGFRVGYNFLLLAWDDRTDVRAKHYVESTLVTALADWQVEPLASFTVVRNLAAQFDDQNRSFVLIGATDSSGYPSLALRAFDTLGAGIMSLRRIYWVGLQTKPFRLGGSLYALVCQYRTGGVDIAWNYGYALLNLSRRFDAIGSSYPVALEGCLAPTDGIGLDVGSTDDHLAWVQVVDSDAYLPLVINAANEEEPAGTPGAAAWVDVARLRSGRTVDGLWSWAHGARLLHLGSALPVQYDGQSAVEIAFLEPPQIVGSVNLTYGGSGPAAGSPDNVYGYLMVWEWIDAQGQVHRSRLSAPFSATISSGSGTNAIVDFEVKLTSITRRGSAADGEATRPRLAVFRTLANGTVYYRLDGNGEVNSTGAATLNFSDDEDDATLLAAGRPGLYTAGGILENETPPPARHVQVASRRVWLTSAESAEVWPSREIVAAEAPAFSALLRISLDEVDERLVGTAWLDGALVIFSERRIFLLDAGAGPGDTGAPPWPSPQALQSSAGCTSGRSIAVFRDGVIYRDPDGFKILTRGRSIVDIGGAVRDLTDANPVTLDVQVDAAQERVVVVIAASETGEPQILVYDYRHAGPEGVGSWSTWSTEEDPATVRAAIWQGSLVTATAGSPCLEGGGATPGYDGIGGGPQWITGTLATPWLRLGALGGYQRVWRTVLELRQMSAHGLSLQVYVDGDDTTPVQTETWTTTQIAALQGLPRERLVVGMAVQKCQSIRLKLSDTAPAVAVAESPTGFRYSGLSLEAGVKKGVEKAQKANTR
ncbi:MAG: hypothetical protein IPL79_19885 [Myxococcales bacterium]|nr:hypothetical protein [Myxococcales bacterium]